MVELNLMNSSS